MAAGIIVGAWGEYANAAPQAASPNPRAMIDRIRSLGDNEGLPIFLIDKVAARLYVFDPAGTLLGDAPVLLGAARGDRSVPGIGDRPLSQVRPEEKTTPAGRFRAERGFNLSGEDIVWVDYDAAVSMHRLRPVSASERRRERLATPTPLDNRISFGCINIPEKFYEAVVDPALRGGKAMVYILPEVESLAAVFGPALAADKIGGKGAQRQTWSARPVNLTIGVKP
jgi:hypothetical protein